jgi:hypothetical protein
VKIFLWENFAKKSLTVVFCGFMDGEEKLLATGNTIKPGCSMNNDIKKPPC